MHQKLKRILALSAVLIIAVLYLITFILAFTGQDGSRKMLTAAFAATVILPVLLYIYMWLYRTFGKQGQSKKTMIPRHNNRAAAKLQRPRCIFTPQTRSL